MRLVDVSRAMLNYSAETNSKNETFKDHHIGPVHRGRELPLAKTQIVAFSFAVMVVVMVAVIFVLLFTDELITIRVATRTSTKNRKIIVTAPPTALPSAYEDVRQLEMQLQALETKLRNIETGSISANIVDSEEVVSKLHNLIDNSVAGTFAPESEPSVPEVEPPVPEVEPVVPEIEHPVPETEPPVPEVEPVVPEIEHLVAEVEPVVPEIEPPVPEVEPVVPETEHLVPEIEPTVPISGP